MPVKLVKKTLKNKYFNFNAIAFIPEVQYNIGALFTHGYTSSKTDCLNWAQRLSESRVTSVIFDLPGHHLGSFNSVNSFEEFRDHAHECFETAFEFLKEVLPDCRKVALGGHSLGALLALKALKELNCFGHTSRVAICVGLGISQHKTAHLFETSFYEKTLNIRRQLVDENLDSDHVFPWIKQEKIDFKIQGHRIHMICGADDVVVGDKGMETLALNLQSQGNKVTSELPSKLPHHQPELAASRIYHFMGRLWVNDENESRLKLRDS